MGLFDKLKTESTEDKERAEAQARLEADERAVTEATERAEAEARLKADEQAVADAEKAAADKEAADRAAAEEAERQRVADEQAAAQRAEDERRAAEATAHPTVSVERLIEVVNHDSDPSTPTGQGMDPQLGGLIEAALRRALADNNLPNANKDDGALGTSFLEAYSVWQGHLGYDGDDANGVPGRASLQKLAEATGMFVVAD